MSGLVRWYVLVLVALIAVVLAGCRAGSARAAQLPQPTSVAQWVAIAVFVLGLWWLALKILRG
jgi:hypothetical protein